jgi:hypothetical protein
MLTACRSLRQRRRRRPRRVGQLYSVCRRRRGVSVGRCVCIRGIVCKPVLFLAVPFPFYLIPYSFDVCAEGAEDHTAVRYPVRLVQGVPSVCAGVACTLPPDNGLVRCGGNAAPLAVNTAVWWYFDAPAGKKARDKLHTSAGVCRAFVYTGCAGNGNRFQSLEICQAVCAPPQSMCPGPLVPVFAGASATILQILLHLWPHSRKSVLSYLSTGTIADGIT